MTIGTQLLENPDCDPSLLLNGVQIGSASRFTSNGDGQFAVWALTVPAGTYRLTGAYTSSGGPIRVYYGGEGEQGHGDLPEAADGDVKVLGFTLAASVNAIVFNDLGDAMTHLYRVDLRQIA